MSVAGLCTHNLFSGYRSEFETGESILRVLILILLSFPVSGESSVQEIVATSTASAKHRKPSLTAGGLPDLRHVPDVGVDLQRQCADE